MRVTLKMRGMRCMTRDIRLIEGLGDNRNTQSTSLERRPRGKMAILPSTEPPGGPCGNRALPLDAQFREAKLSGQDVQTYQASLDVEEGTRGTPSSPIREHHHDSSTIPKVFVRFTTITVRNLSHGDLSTFAHFPLAFPISHSIPPKPVFYLARPASLYSWS